MYGNFFKIMIIYVNNFNKLTKSHVLSNLFFFLIYSESQHQKHIKSATKCKENHYFVCLCHSSDVQYFVIKNRLFEHYAGPLLTHPLPTPDLSSLLIPSLKYEFGNFFKQIFCLPHKNKFLHPPPPLRQYMYFIQFI